MTRYRRRVREVQINHRHCALSALERTRMKVYLRIIVVIFVAGLLAGAQSWRHNKEEWPYLASGDIVHVGVPDDNRRDGVASVRSSGSHAR